MMTTMTMMMDNAADGDARMMAADGGDVQDDDDDDGDDDDDDDDDEDAPNPGPNRNVEVQLCKRTLCQSRVGQHDTCDGGLPERRV